METLHSIFEVLGLVELVDHLNFNSPMAEKGLQLKLDLAS